MMECFETNLPARAAVARLEVVGRHAAPPCTTRPNIAASRCGSSGCRSPSCRTAWAARRRRSSPRSPPASRVLILAMIFVPFPLKMEANGPALAAASAQYLYSPMPGKVEDIQPG